MIKAEGLAKRYGNKVVVDAIDFTVRPGQVTGFLGPNGAGKSTTMRMIVGLDRPTAGRVEVNGRPYREHGAPLREVGVLLDAKAAHGGRSAYKHLLSIGATGASAGSLWGWASAWVSRQPCWATQRRSSSTSR
jgi:ABC-2 type transport system ATP-binding protein